MFFFRCHLLAGIGGIQFCFVTDFRRHDGADACVSLIKEVLYLLTFLHMEQRGKAAFFQFHRVFLILRRGEHIGFSRQDFSDRAFVVGNTLDGIQNLIVFVCKNQVAVFAHDFQNQVFHSHVAHFVGRLHFDDDDTFKVWLANVNDFAACNVFAQYHAEQWCCHGVFSGVFGDVHPGMTGIGRSQHFIIGADGAHGKADFVGKRLMYLVDSAAHEFLFQFGDDGCGGDTVQCHSNPSFLFC